MSSSPPPVAELLAELGRAFAALGLRWFLFGAQAAVLHGVARLTADVDVTVELGAHSSAALVDALTRAGFDLRIPDVAGFVEATRVLPFVHRRSRMPVDVVLAGPGLEEQFLARAEEREIGGARIPVASAEDLVAMKVLAGRGRDLEDVEAIVRIRPDLDLSRIRSVLRLLEMALDRGDLVSEIERVVTWVTQGRR